ncbi:MAG TPA: hypothetical protein VIQ23_04875 [Hanamia sp.]
MIATGKFSSWRSICFKATSHSHYDSPWSGYHRQRDYRQRSRKNGGGEVALELP